MPIFVFKVCEWFLLPIEIDLVKANSALIYNLSSIWIFETSKKLFDYFFFTKFSPCLYFVISNFIW
jgi:hypothetical protein